MNPESLQDIYNTFLSRELSSSDLLFYLSRYDLKHEMTRETFKKRNRVHRTIITEIKRFIEQKKTGKNEEWKWLKETYIKDYLYFCAARDLNYQSLNFADYVHSLIENNRIIKQQYEHLDMKEMFWKTISQLEQDMQIT